MILGGEISASRDHFNALFLQNTDAPELRDKVPARRIAAANQQGAFVFWNHPGWTAKYKDGNCPRDEAFIELIKTGQIKGIEICNGDGYWEGAHELALEYGLTLIGDSDIHGVSTYPYQPEKHRTITLVFAHENSVEGVQEALLDHRTAIYQGDHLIGPEDFLKPLFFESLDIETEYEAFLYCPANGVFPARHITVGVCGRETTCHQQPAREHQDARFHTPFVICSRLA